MNPIYTGKDVAYIDTKQANRAAENAVLQAERFAVFAGLLTGALYPQAALAKAWVQLVYGAHHDAITGSESDQVYLDLLTGWRDAWELGRAARDNSLAALSSAVGTARGDVIVWNPLTCRRTDIVTARLDQPVGARVRVLDSEGAELAAHVEHDGRSVSWLARDVPSLGWRAYRLVPAPDRDFYLARQAYDPFTERRQPDPLGGDALRWATVTGDTLRTYSLAILDDGTYELQTYDRTLTPDGIRLDWRRSVDGQVVRQATGHAVRAQ